MLGLVDHLLLLCVCNLIDFFINMYQLYKLMGFTVTFPVHAYTMRWSSHPLLPFLTLPSSPPSAYCICSLHLDHISFFFLVVVVQRFELRTSHLLCRLSTTCYSTSPFLCCDGYFRDRSSWTICPGWFRTVILLISAWVARITGVSHQHPAV
jgi:hypothetical protein